MVHAEQAAVAAEERQGFEEAGAYGATGGGEP